MADLPMISGSEAAQDWEKVSSPSPAVLAG
jgi:hypothetical protein